jgi:hypothetical protein
METAISSEHASHIHHRETSAIMATLAPAGGTMNVLTERDGTGALAACPSAGRKSKNRASRRGKHRIMKAADQGL